MLLRSFRTLPDYSLDTMPEDYAALILIGGFGWLNGQEAERVVPIVRNAIGRGIIVGGNMQRGIIPRQTRISE